MAELLTIENIVAFLAILEATAGAIPNKWLRYRSVILRGIRLLAQFFDELGDEKPKPPPSGRIDFKAMAAVFAAGVLMVSVLGGCDWLREHYVKPAQPVCDQVEYQGVICDLFRSEGLEPELVNDLVLTAVDVVLVVEDGLVYGPIIQEYTGLIRQYLDRNPVVTAIKLSDLVGFAKSEAQSRAIASILSRHLNIIDVDLTLDEGSYNLIMAHLDAIDAEVDLITGSVAE